MIERLKLLASFLLVVAAANVGAEGNAQKIYRRLLPPSAPRGGKCGGERFVGSGVVALADDVAVTAWHVIFDARAVWAIFADGQRVQVVGCIDRDASRDLALIKLEKRLPHRRAGLAREMQSVASRAYVIGAPKGYAFSISDGLVSQIREVDGYAHYQISCPISPATAEGR
jgi:S1-C subfamily serine protease